MDVQQSVKKDKLAWQEALSDLITDPQELWELLKLDPCLLQEAGLAAKDFALKIPRRFINRMRQGDINDPLLRQVLPLGMELMPIPGYGLDPLQEAKANPVPGLLHKYHGRVLVTLTGACAIHCRYCFRRHFPYQDNNPGKSGWKKIFAYVMQDHTINEVILSGGDPLTVNDKLLSQFSEELTAIPHIKRLRIHTRLPVVLPERITTELIAWLQQLSLQKVMVIHANHPNEINDEVKLALQNLRLAGVHLLNQTVLLKGVNDEAATLINLSEVLFAIGVFPYYLHVLDKVQGAAHFDLDLTHVQALYAALAAGLPGYLVPKLVYEKPGAPSKSLL